MGLGRAGEAVERFEQVSRWCDRERVIEPAVFKVVPGLIEAYALSGARSKAEAALSSPPISRNTSRRPTLARSHTDAL